MFLENFVSPDIENNFDSGWICATTQRKNPWNGGRFFPPTKKMMQSSGVLKFDPFGGDAKSL